MLDIPEKVRQLCRKNNDSPETEKTLKLSFFSTQIDALYPSNDLYPSGNLYPSGTGEPWLTIEGDQIYGETLELTESLCLNNRITWGSCEAAKFSITVSGVEEALTGCEFIAVLSIGSYQMAYGIYTVESAVRQEDRTKRKITAYDRMIRFDIDVSGWYHAMYPDNQQVHTIKELRDSLCDYVGVSQHFCELMNDDMEVGKTIDPETLSGRDVLKAICEINGVFGHIDRTGVLAYVRLQETGLYPSEETYPSETLYPRGAWDYAEDIDFYRSITYEDYLIDGIDQVQVRQEEGDIGAVVGSGKNAYIVEGNFLAYGLGSADLTKLAWSIYDVIAGRSYRPAKISTYAMPWIEVGDGLRAVTTDMEVATFVLTRTMSGIQAMMDTVEAKGTKTQKQSFGVQSEIIQLKGKTAVIIKNVDEVSAAVTDLEKDTTAKIKVVSDQITAEVKRAEAAEASLSIKADQILTSVTDLRTNTSSRFEQTANQIALKVSKGEVSSQISVESGGVDIKGNRFSWSSTYSSMTADGKLSAVSGSFSGDITANAFKTVDGSIVLANGKLTITGAEINGTTNTSTIGCKTLSANNGNISTLDCQTGNISSVNANSIWCGGDINCKELYPSGSWWKGWGLTETLRWLDGRISSLGG